MGDLHQKLTELKKCFDDGLIRNQEQYESTRDRIIEFWITHPPPPKEPEKSFWQRLYDTAVSLKDKVMENIIRPIISRVNQLLIRN